MAFWGAEVKPGKAVPFVPPPEASKLHLSQACLSTKAKPGAKAALKVCVGEGGQELAVCCLREGGTESAGLDLIFDQYTEFRVEGGAPVHLTGYFMPEYEMGHDDDSEDDEGEYPGGQLLGYDQYGHPIIGGGEGDSDDDFDSEEFDSEESDEEDVGGDLNPARRQVVIEDVTEQEGQPKGKKAPPALPAPKGQQANGKAAAFADDDVSASDEDDDEVDEEESEEGSDEEDSEEEQQQAAAARQAAAAGQKRKAEQQPEAKPAAKAAKPDAAQQGAAQHKAQQPQQQHAAAKQQQQQQQQAADRAGKSKVRKFPNGFEIEDLKQGRPDGKLAKAGKKVVMKYVGKLKTNGKVFDQTKGNATFSFRLGVGEVIKGWDRGVEGMRVGDKRRLTIPPQMAYGTSGVRGAIPPNATLVFDVELVDVK